MNSARKPGRGELHEPFPPLAAPGGTETRHIVNADVLRALGPRGALVNIARGTLVDAVGAAEALRTGTILAAGLDVFENEPHVPAELIALDDAVLLPHVGSASEDTRNAMAEWVVANLVAWSEGRPHLTPVPETPGGDAGAPTVRPARQGGSVGRTMVLIDSVETACGPGRARRLISGGRGRCLPHEGRNKNIT